jgi:transposase
MSLDLPREGSTAIRTNLGAIFVSLELSRSTWLIRSLSPGGGEKMSKHSVSAGDIAALLARFSELMKKAFVRTGRSFPIIVIKEAGLDGFWVHRLLHNEGIESYVVDPASIATSRRRRRAKTDKIDGEALVRALLAYKRGEPRVCAMARAPTPEEEDRRPRERKTLTVERVQHQGIIVFPGCIRLRALAPQPTPTARRIEDGRCAMLAAASQGSNQPRA